LGEYTGVGKTGEREEEENQKESNNINNSTEFGVTEEN